ncbi:MAG: hypothetical protein ACRC0B_03715 [Legionella sp.]
MIHVSILARLYLSRCLGLFLSIVAVIEQLPEYPQVNLLQMLDYFIFLPIVNN